MGRPVNRLWNRGASLEPTWVIRWRRDTHRSGVDVLPKVKWHPLLSMEHYNPFWVHIGLREETSHKGHGETFIRHSKNKRTARRNLKVVTADVFIPLTEFSCIIFSLSFGDDKRRGRNWLGQSVIWVQGGPCGRELYFVDINLRVPPKYRFHLVKCNS